MDNWKGALAMIPAQYYGLFGEMKKFLFACIPSSRLFLATALL
jgi:hypothetical protein